MATDLSLIIPQHGRSELTIRCLETLLEHHQGSLLSSLEIILVDDGSPRFDLLKIQQRAFPQTTIVRVSPRKGVTHAWNQGAEVAQGTWLIFLNNDVLTTGPWCEHLLAPLRAGNGIVTGPELRSEKRLPAYLRPLIPTQLILAGWCFALSKLDYTEIGRFDERFQLYYSDTDLQLRLMQKYHSPGVLTSVADLPLAHLGHRSTRQFEGRRREWVLDDRAFALKWLGRT